MEQTSEPASKPSGVVKAAPTRPRLASESRMGVRAASKGVCPLSSGTGRSAPPSGITITYFTEGGYAPDRWVGAVCGVDPATIDL